MYKVDKKESFGYFSNMYNRIGVVCYPKKVMQTHDDEENAREEFLKELPSRT
jgi:hypothetical protein